MQPTEPIGKCPLCGNNSTYHASARDIEYFTSDRTFDYYLCHVCDVLYIDPMLSSELASIYPPNYYSYGSSDNLNWVSMIKEWLDRRSLSKFLSQVQGKNLSLLDVGGGEGWLSTLVRNTDPRISNSLIIDMDPNAEMRAKAKGHRYFCGMIESLDTKECFDIILMLNLIEHVADPSLVLRKANSLLSPGGRILIKTPNFRALDALIFRNLNWGGYHCPRHFFLFSKQSLVTAVEGAGFRVASVSFTQGAPFWSVSLLDLLRRSGFVSVSAKSPSIGHPLMPFLQALAAAFDYARMPFAETSQMFLVAEKGQTENPVIQNSLSERYIRRYI